MRQDGEVRRSINPAIVVKILSQVVVDPHSGCWVAPGRESKYKRVQVERGGRGEQAHRYLYEVFVGSIPAGFVLDHLCGKRGCMNPFHMEPVTLQTNIRRGRTGLRNAAKTHCVHGHPLSGENLRLTYVGDAAVRCCKICKALACKRWRSRRKARAQEV